jgi:hypothetical protein
MSGMSAATETVPITARLWAAVDRLTLPSSRRLLRENDPEAQLQVLNDLREQARRAAEDEARPKPKSKAGNDLFQVVVPQVSRNDLARYAQMKTGHATVPSLWDQSTDALCSSTADKAEGSSGSVHRTPCDLDLMEVRADIREAVDFNIAKRGEKPTGTVPEQIRHLTSMIIRDEPHAVEHWEYRFAQWGRILAAHLQAVQAQPKPRRIRGVACPECHVRTVLVEDATGEMVNVPPIVVDFRDGLIRAAECTGCGTTLAFRGEEMWALKDRLDTLMTA